MKHELIELMQSLRFEGMKTSFESLIQSKSSHSLSHDELLNILLQAEWDNRENKKLHRKMLNAKFRYKASIEEIDYITPRGLDKTQLLRLSDTSFIQRAESIIITGATGVGKSYIATALGHQACSKNYNVAYFNSQKLFAMLYISKADESYAKAMKKIAKQDLLIIDDFGLQVLDQQKRLMLLEIIEDRHNVKSTIIASQLPTEKWYDIIGESTIADAILDRLVHTAHRIELKGESLRRKKN